MPWQPTILPGTTPLYARLTDAIAQDIENGTLPPDAKLPPHRDLAHRLSVSVGTVTRAYADAERRGLLTAHVGRGSFVTPRPTPVPYPIPSEGPLDLSCNRQPFTPTSERLADALNALRTHPDYIAAATDYIIPEGPLSAREAMSRWTHHQFGVNRPASTMIQCAGGQQGLAYAISGLTVPGDTILCEALTYPGVKTLARHIGRALHGVTLDQDGLCPEALAEAARTTGAKLLFIVPNVQNPTTRTMSLQRRQDIVAVARQYDLTIIEDDAYGLYVDSKDRPTAIANLAPERTIYLISVSKVLSAGLRVGYLFLPPNVPRSRIIQAERAFGHSPQALGALAVAHWIETGTADDIAREIQQESALRHTLAKTILGPAMEHPTHGRAPHVWLPLPPLQAEQVVTRALRKNVQVTPPSAPLVTPQPMSGIRVCLNVVPTREALATALHTVRTALTADLCLDEALV